MSTKLIKEIQQFCNSIFQDHTIIYSICSHLFNVKFLHINVTDFKIRL